MKKDEKQALILLGAFILIVLSSLLFGGCSYTYIDSIPDPFYNCDTTYQHGGGVFEIGK